MSLSKNRPLSILLIERLVANRKKPVPPQSVFDSHHNHHKNNQVDKTSFQASRLGLKYLGFGRYGKIKNDKDPTNNKKFEVTHIVKNGLLVPVINNFTSDTDEYVDDNDYIPELKKTNIKRFYDINRDEVKKYVDNMGVSEKKKFDKQINALQKYVAAGFVDINKVLFNGLEKKASPRIIHAIRQMDNMFHHDYAKAKTDLTLYTGTTANIEKGQTYVFKGFMSTSIDPKIAKIFANPDVDDDSKYHVSNKKVENAPPVVIQIDVKKGQRILDVMSSLDAAGGIYPTAYQQTEKEFILPRNTYLNIIDGPIHMKGQSGRPTR